MYDRNKYHYLNFLGNCNSIPHSSIKRSFEGLRSRLRKFSLGKIFQARSSHAHSRPMQPSVLQLALGLLVALDPPIQFLNHGERPEVFAQSLLIFQKIEGRFTEHFYYLIYCPIYSRERGKEKISFLFFLSKKERLPRSLTTRLVALVFVGVENGVSAVKR